MLLLFGLACRLPRVADAQCQTHQANLKRAYSQFTEDILEGCAKQAEFRAIVFALCYFHAALLERKKFGVGNLPGATSGMCLFGCAC